MPILEIESVVSDPDQAPTTDRTAALADAAAQVFGASSGQVWVKLRFIPPEEYAENGGNPPDVHPVFVKVLKSRLPAGSALQEEILQLTQAIARVLERPTENIHIIYQPPGVGRVAFGGKLVQ